MAAKVHHVKKARKTIYERGIVKTLVYKNGKRKGQTYNKKCLTTPHPVQDGILVERGRGYWWWEFKNGGKQISLVDPGVLYKKMGGPTEMESKCNDWDQRYQEDPQEFMAIHSEIEEYRDELDEKLLNMPDQLQEGHILNEYLEQLDTRMDDLMDGNDV